MGVGVHKLFDQASYLNGMNDFGMGEKVWKMTLEGENSH